MLDNLATAGNIGRHYGLSHCCRFKQRSRRAFAIRWEYDAVSTSDMRPHIVCNAQIFNNALSYPAFDLIMRDRRSVLHIQESEKCTFNFWVVRPEYPRRLYILHHALIIEQSRDKQKSDFIFYGSFKFFWKKIP